MARSTPAQGDRRDGRLARFSVAMALAVGTVACGDMSPLSRGAQEDDDGKSGGPSESFPGLRLAGRGALEPGTLTAGVWDDNLNFGYYLGYLSRMESLGLAGLPVVERADRVVVSALDAAGLPVAGGRLSARSVDSDEAPAVLAVTGADGKVLVFPAWDGLGAGAVELTLEGGGARATHLLGPGDRDVVLRLPAAAAPVRRLDVALVLDTTGSMGDELEYLATEFDAMSARLRRDWPEARQRWALVAYRDDGDEYLTRVEGFTEDLGAFRTALARERAEGGGDIPEASDRALEAAAELDWSDGVAARVLFHVTDAPQHAGAEGRLLGALRRLRAAGVRVYPVAAGGTGQRAEFALRTEAQVTLGRYLFLTDDSGVGGAQTDPSLPCYFVTRLDSAMLRMIHVELSGRYREPLVGEIVRQAGDVENGSCELSDGQRVLAF